MSVGGPAQPPATHAMARHGGGGSVPAGGEVGRARVQEGQAGAGRSAVPRGHGGGGSVPAGGEVGRARIQDGQAGAGRSAVSRGPARAVLRRW